MKNPNFGVHKIVKNRIKCKLYSNKLLFIRKLLCIQLLFYIQGVFFLFVYTFKLSLLPQFSPIFKTLGEILLPETCALRKTKNGMWNNILISKRGKELQHGISKSQYFLKCPQLTSVYSGFNFSLMHILDEVNRYFY